MRQRGFVCPGRSQSLGGRGPSLLAWEHPPASAPADHLGPDSPEYLVSRSLDPRPATGRERCPERPRRAKGALTPRLRGLSGFWTRATGASTLRDVVRERWSGVPPVRGRRRALSRRARVAVAHPPPRPDLDCQRADAQAPFERLRSAPARSNPHRPSRAHVTRLSSSGNVLTELCPRPEAPGIPSLLFLVRPDRSDPGHDSPPA